MSKVKPIVDKESLFSAVVPAVKVFIKALDRDVFIRKITGSDRLEFLALFDEAKKSMDEDTAESKVNDRSLERSVSLGLSNEAGDRLFGADDLEELAKLPIEVLNAVALATMKENSLGDKPLEEAEGNSEPDQN